MIDVFEIMTALPDVLAESAESRSRRNAHAWRLMGPPPAGTPLLVSLALAFEHTGIYLGGGRVAELNGDGHVKSVSLTRFINGEPSSDFHMRSGTRIFAACDARTRMPLASARALETARRALAESCGWRGYDPLQVNCHLFTAACVRGVLLGERGFRRILGGGIASIGRLESLLARTLNGGRPMSWRAVRRGGEEFRYSLTAEKRTRLLLEGK